MNETTFTPVDFETCFFSVLNTLLPKAASTLQKKCFSDDQIALDTPQIPCLYKSDMLYTKTLYASMGQR